VKRTVSNMPKRLFGTDGIRGVAGEFPLDQATVFACGVALADDAKLHAPAPEVLIGMDTRESGNWIASYVAAGLASRGVRTRFAGVITTPGIAYLTKTYDFVAGVMISASHNQYQDNGIKVFGHSGYKLPDEEEHAIEEEIFRLLEQGVSPGGLPLEEDAGLDQHYVRHLLETSSTSLAGMKVVLDCGHGAAYALAPDLFRRAGANVETVCCEPNGRNINLGCGALHVGNVREAVLAKGADVGVAFDGDADRAMFISKTGHLVDGDAVLLIAARALKRAGRLSQDTVVSTVMANLGLEEALARESIRMLRTAVGDKYVLEEMIRSGAVLGGEQSGHIIFHELATTGDGLLTALQVLEISRLAGLGLDELVSGMQLYPQKLVNIRVKEKKPLEDLGSVQAAIRECERELDGAGRILVRFSGTEPLARVMVEAPETAQVEGFTARIAAAIERELGSGV